MIAGMGAHGFAHRGKALRRPKKKVCAERSAPSEPSMIICDRSDLRMRRRRATAATPWYTSACAPVTRV